MTQNAHQELDSAAGIQSQDFLPPLEPSVLSPEPEADLPDQDLVALRERAVRLASSMAWLPGQPKSRSLRDRSRRLPSALGPLLSAVESRPPKDLSSDFRWLRDNTRMVEADLDGVIAAFKPQMRIPQARVGHGSVSPRILAIAEDFLDASGFQFGEAGFTAYIAAFQEVMALRLVELRTLSPVLKLVLLEQIAARGRQLPQDPEESSGVDVLVRSLRDVGLTSWKDVTEPLIPFDHILREDPAGAYARMDYESRELYRNRLVQIADRSDYSETMVASEAVSLARKAAASHESDDPRLTLRHSHVGAYLLAERTPQLEHSVGFRAPLMHRLRSFLRLHPDEFYLPGITVLTSAIVVGVVLLITDPQSSPVMVLLALLATVLPASQSAVQMMNYFVSALIPTQILPKLDLSDGLPEDCVTLVAVPTMLLNERQVHKLIEDLEVRFLGNRDPNLHFLLLSDLPDSPFAPNEDDPLVDLCSELIDCLNQKYAEQKTGSFFFLHRHRTYNPREKLWMGWERKRGKLMDLNKLLRSEFDAFPRKAGDLSVLSSVRFVITLDSDTELPRGSAHRMVGAIAHPLNQAIIEPHRGVVVAGYGILQPRVGISVQSTARSRLASIYSGQTGLDIYTRAVSDVYQDLYDEGIFVGKGIYEVETLHRVLDGRFPRNALLSHDLVEGAYARAGLVSDIEIIEDCPSHYNAHNRRKHRWLRGDWQIAGWLRRSVLDESGKWVDNPLSVVSRWKILDNLRRSLVEPATFVLLVLGWFLLPGRPWAWTLATIAILFLPTFVQLLFDLVRAAVVKTRSGALDAVGAFVDAGVANWLTFAFLAHQALLSMDAVVRTIVRRLVTRQRLLQWETAAQAELSGQQRTALDIYLDYAPVLALALFLLLVLLNRSALLAATPVLVLWACSQPLSRWLNRPAREPRRQAGRKDRWLLHFSALRIWRYFAEFSTEEHNWLIPDNVQEDPPIIAGRISPTNLGFLLNARQVACTFGYLTTPELADLTLQTLASVRRLPRHRGHLLNWYDTRSLLPLPPAVVSSVDNGNLVASLWTLQSGCIELLHRPLLQPALAAGFLDNVHALVDLGALDRRRFSEFKRDSNRQNWLQFLITVPDTTLEAVYEGAANSKNADDARWFGEQARERIHHARRTARLYSPWLLPEFARLENDRAVLLQRLPSASPLGALPGFIDNLSSRLQAALKTAPSVETGELHRSLLSLLPEARANVVSLIKNLREIADEAGRIASEMDFGVLLDQKRGLLSVGLDVATEKLLTGRYDLLATESRIAVFAGIAKDDIPQESWFLLGRSHTIDHGRAVLRSWSGTMFEYLMPALWMRIYPNTLLERSLIAAVRSQRAHADSFGIPWGISESAYFRTDGDGNYQYYAFGLPQLAAGRVDLDGPVISPYSTFLALHVDPAAALENLRTMLGKRWAGVYGFYEAIDFHASRRRARFRGPEVVRTWMAHHQGMSLLSIANFLQDDIVQRWFHKHPQVQATELLLQEKPATHVRPTRRSFRSRVA